MFPKPEKKEKPESRGLQRKTPLQSKTQLQSRSKLKARPNGGHKYAGVKKTGRCQICGRWLGEGNTAWHHIVYRSQGGGDTADNLIEVGLGMPWVCDCHRKMHAGEISRAEVLAAKVRQRGAAQ